MKNKCDKLKQHFTKDTIYSKEYYIRDCINVHLDDEVLRLSIDPDQDYLNIDNRHSKSIKKILDYVFQVICPACVTSYELDCVLIKKINTVFMKYHTTSKLFDKNVNIFDDNAYQTSLKEVVTDRIDRIRIGLLDSMMSVTEKYLQNDETIDNFVKTMFSSNEIMGKYGN